MGNVLVRHLSYGGLSLMFACSSLSRQRMSPEQTATATSLLSFEKQNKMDNTLKTYLSTSLLHLV